MHNTNTTTDFDLSSQAFIENPYPTYAKLRKLDAPYWLPFYSKHRQTDNESGMWLIARYDDVDSILQNHQHTSTNIKSALSGTVNTAFEQTMLQLDPPDHTRLRNFASIFFKANTINRLESRIQEVTDEILFNKKDIDFVAEFANRMPVKIIAEMLGIPEDDIPLLHEYSHQVVQGLDYIISNPEQRDQQLYAVNELKQYFTELLKKPHKLPESSITYALLATNKNTKQLSPSEIVSTLILLFSAGHGNISSVLGTGLMTLLQHSQQKLELINNPDLIDSAINEMLRYESPLQRSVLRIVTDELQLGNQTFHRGDNLSLMIGSANRDETKYDRADEFIITRTAGRNLTFGAGIHACFGAHLSRLQMKIAFTRLFKHYPNIQLIENETYWTPLTMIRELESLPVSLYR